MRAHQLLLLMALMACPAGKGGSGSASSDENAPFALNKFDSALFFGEVDEDGEWGEGYLLLSTEEVSCDDIGDDEFYDILTDPIGSGLLFLVQWYREDPEDEDPLSGFEGLYLGGYGYNYEEEAARVSLAVAFHEGYYYILSGYYSGGSWIRFDQVSESAAEGEFDTEYWSGTFDADNCGLEVSEGGDYYDSGYYYK